MKDLQKNSTSVIDRFAEYLILIAAAISLTCNLCLLIALQENISENLPRIVILSAVFLFLPCFFKKAAKLAFIAGYALLLVWIFYMQIKFHAVRQFLSEIFTTRYYVVSQADSFISIVLCVMAALCCLLMFFVSKSRVSILITSVAGIALVFILSLTDVEYSLPALLVFMGCCAVLYLRRAALSSIAHSGVKAKGMAGLTAVAAVGCAAALICSQLSFSKLSSDFGNLPKINLSDAISKIIDIIPKPEKTGFGDYNPSQKLGQKITYDNTTVLEVVTDKPIYLRGRIYDTYTGKNWSVRSGNNDIYTESTFNKAPGYAAVLLNSTNLKNGSLSAIFSNEDFYSFSPLLNQTTIKVTIKNDGQKYLFFPSDGYDDQLTYLSEKVKLQRSYPDMLTNIPLADGTSYSVQYYSPYLYSDEFKAAEKTSASDYAAMMADSRIKDYMKKYNEYNNEIRSAYMGTQNVTQRTRDLTLSITKNCKNEFEKADAIKNWLQKNCTYTLSPRQPFWGRDFVDFFLFDSHSGYCEHFATAMTVMLRAAGVPARYVEGYATPSISKFGTYEVTNRQAHAWVEYYSNMYGFLTIDPTPPQSLPATYTNEEIMLQSEIQTSSAPSTPTSSIPSSSRAPSSKPSAVASSSPAKASSLAPRSKAAGQASPKALMLASAFGVAALLLLLYGGKSALRAVRFHALSHRTRRERVMWLYGYFADALSHLGFDRPPSATPNEFADTVRGRIEFGKIDFDRVTQIYVSARFGSSEISDDDIEAVHEFYHDFLKNCRRYTGTAAFILKYPLL